jgi:hypothetical protein
MNPAVVIPNKNTTLHVDRRGRVRFSFGGHRFEITKSTVSAYNRMWYGEQRTLKIPVRFLNNRLFMLKLCQAQEIFDV